MSVFDRSEILPPDPDLPEMEVLHNREYTVRAFRKDPNLLIRGSVRDQKPPNLYIADDDEPLTIHHMQVDLEVTFPALEIVAATVVFQMFPNDECPSITEHYDKLVGLSIARGFTHRVRELFGGPRGCTHTTALLQAMAPVAVQCSWSMQMSDMRRRGEVPQFARDKSTREERQAHVRRNLNTCHVWQEGGAVEQEVLDGTRKSGPLFITRRLAEIAERDARAGA